MKSRLILLSFLLFICSCTANFYVTRDEFLTQVAENQIETKGSAMVAAPPFFFPVTFTANNISKLLCRDKNGELVYLFPDKNTQIEVTRKSTGDVVKMYFGTVLFDGTKLVGQRSRILPGMNREIEFSDIEKIVIYSEFPKVEKTQTE
jgi:hypothetical protein